MPLVSLKSGKMPDHIEKISVYRQKLWKNIRHPTVREKFKKATQTLQTEMNKFFKNKEKRLLHKKSPKQIYNYVSSQLKSKKSAIPALKNSDNILVTNSEKANFFGQYFSSIVHKNSTSENDEISENFPLSGSKLDFVNIENLDVYKRLLVLENKNNTSPDGVPNIFIKSCAESLTFPISYIFQYVMMSGNVPDLWKQSYVLPLYKKGEQNIVSNYRPISLTCSIGKIFESIIYESLLSFFEKNDILPQEQHGFSKGKSVSSQLLETLDDITAALENKSKVDIIYFDIAKAFDSISHAKLISKLNAAGIGGVLLTIIKNWLSNRNFQVKLDDTLSDPFLVNVGVPQGSILGPLLFNFYISDVVKICETENVILKFFADDLKAYVIYSDPVAHIYLQAFINKFATWCKNNDLKISWEKCKVLYMGKNSPKLPYQIDDIVISEVTDNIRDLGILITSDLKWKTHIDHICRQAFGKLFTLFKAVRSCDPKFLTRMYTSYVRPVLEFSSSVFNPYQKTDINKLEKVQKIATKLIHYRCFRNQLFSYNETLSKLGLKTLQERRLIADLILYHKIMHNKVRISSKHKQKSVILRNRIKIHTETCKNNARIYSFFIRMPRIYTKFPISVVSDPNITSFKSYVLNQDLSQFLIVKF